MSKNKESLSLVILGMHRSGTSLTASILQDAGVDIGEQLAPATPTNLKGHFEDIEFVNFHRQVLISQGLNDAGWTNFSQVSVPEQYVSLAKQLINKRTHKPLWGWKDPRTVLFLDFWQKLLPNAFYIFVYRSPWETIDSLYRRNIQFVDEVFYKNPNLALQTWENYNQAILNFSQQYPEKSILMPLEYILNDPQWFIETIAQRINYKLNSPKAELLDQSLLKTEVTSSHRPTLLQEFFPSVIELYQKLDKSSLSNGSLYKETLSSSLDYKHWVLQDWLDVRRLEFLLNKTENSLQHQEQSMLELQQENQSLKQKISEMKASKFWKLRNLWFQIKSTILKKFLTN